MATVNEAKLLKSAKAGKTHSQAAADQGLTIGQLPMIQFCRAQVESGQFGKIPATKASVQKARKEGNRWELIAARSGLSVAKVKDLFGGEDAAKKSYTGRGRNFSGSKSPAKNKTRQAGAKGKGGGKARTLAQRQKKAGNPS